MVDEDDDLGSLEPQEVESEPSQRQLDDRTKEAERRRQSQTERDEDVGRKPFEEGQESLGQSMDRASGKQRGLDDVEDDNPNGNGDNDSNGDEDGGNGGLSRFSDENVPDTMKNPDRVDSRQQARKCLRELDKLSASDFNSPESGRLVHEATELLEQAIEREEKFDM